ncbi:cache domain-containing protein [Halarcobacter ebronensis]|uniref:histidine kinase n=1 Tax=Halarcobacter ebronensis TaxID=1462615 RepID=A0A4Q1AQB3_9BACT|nr:cache domain-containing protein [Halarcobacter ebronensis]QKF80739.1 Cache sensor-containing signal transduction histidine kinase [Halarcobacter ebronensis]RXK08532.1 histidine kinase [Halarcobacter ebronensis]
MFIKNERELLSFVKYSPIIIIVIVAIIVNSLVYYQNESNLKKDLEFYKENYIKTNKQDIKLHVEKILDLINKERVTLEIQLRQSLEQRVNEAYLTIDNIYKKFPNKREEELLQIVKESLRGVRFNDNRGYFTLTGMNGDIVMHPINSNYEGINIFKKTESNTINTLKTVINILKKEDKTFTKIEWYKPKDTKQKYEKVAFYRLFKPLNIFIGTAEYRSDFEEYTKNKILEYIQNVTFGENGYVFVFDYEGKQLAHVKRSYVGQNRIDLKDSNGVYITKTIIEQAKKGPGYVSYVGTIMPATNKPAEKITYVLGLSDWKWAIASGFYTKDMYDYLEKKSIELEKINNSTYKRIVLISLFLSIILIFIALYISKILNKFFDEYKLQIEKELQANRNKDIILYQQSKMASMGEMIGNIAHQWRQPLNLISTAASGMKLQDELGISTEKSKIASIDAILDSTQYLSKTIDDFRSFFNPNKEEIVVNSKTMYEKAIKLIEGRLKNHNIELETELEEFEFETYENELIQALINIINNSVDALKDLDNNKDNRKIFISINRQNSNHLIIKNQNFQLENNKDYLYIRIKDNAGGISSNIIDKIFDAYFTTKHQTQGTGIGLYMTYQIIVKHLHGYIYANNETYTVDDKKYTGAKFVIIVPIHNK